MQAVESIYLYKREKKKETMFIIETIFPFFNYQKKSHLNFILLKFDPVLAK